MRYAIIENEHFALESLKKTIAMLRPDYQFVFASESVEDSIAYFNSRPEVDLVFMDIELVDGNCFEIFNEVQVAVPIIFTTAYDEFALQAFKVNSVDYLLKPIHEGDLEKALLKYERNSTAKPMAIDLSRLYDKVAENWQKQRILTISGDSYSYVETNDIAFFASEDKCIFAYRKGGGRRLTEMTSLSEVENIVRRREFFKLSRDIVVHISSIESVRKFFHGRLSVTVKAGEEQRDVVVSTAKRKEFLNWLGGK
ncbi:MAG: LytTR family DNA-binding domain-containing protein [Prevotella sp.]|uniref:LytR/AlgR family response regulator transcription factor n=1 Tax=Prevotella sp. TaxID=59823 RepID=UPI002A2D3E2A|nr:LytTR family transcriptional regulator DNA-binding domain-containing protein [Prevotella sp.]MDD7318957.1 LytTR family DNA-binding domain-containing protein [Prevotellaceae bacterium]MDY4019983.1 LytTR family DNA-binding domain-containing protein [Prevotella sp.]